MLETYLRPHYQKFLVDPLAARLQCYRFLSPQWITLYACVLGVFAALLLWQQHQWIACFVLLLSGYLDTLDGTLARMTQMSSAEGAVFDIVGDRVVEFAVILGLFSVEPAVRALPVLWMLGSVLICVSSFLVVGIFVEKEGQKSFYYSAGLIERAEAFLFFAAMMLLPEWFVGLAWVFSGLVLLTAALRVFQFCKRDI